MLYFLLELNASACSYVYMPAPIVSPEEGIVPPGFAIRASGAGPAQPPVLTDDETPIALEELGEGLWYAPESLDPGVYWMDGVRLEVSSTANTPQPEPPSLIAVSDVVERVPEGYTASCIDYLYRRHLIRTVQVDIPAAQGTGWAVKVTDEVDGHMTWMGVGSEPSEQSITLDLGRVRDATEDACITLSLHSPAGEEVWSEAYPCESSSAGCSTVSATSMLTAALALLGVARRRRD